MTDAISKPVWSYNCTRLVTIPIRRQAEMSRKTAVNRDLQISVLAYHWGGWSRLPPPPPPPPSKKGEGKGGGISRPTFAHIHACRSPRWSSHRSCQTFILVITPQSNPRFPAPSFKFCHNWLVRHWRGLLYLRASVHRQCPEIQPFFVNIYVNYIAIFSPTNPGGRKVCACQKRRTQMTAWWGQHWGNFLKRGWSAYELSRARGYHLELNWSELKGIIDLQAGEAGTSELPSWSRPEAERETDPWSAGLKNVFVCFLGILYEHLSSASFRAEPCALHNDNYIALFAASDQTHCALVVCDSESMTVACSAQVFCLFVVWCVCVGCCCCCCCCWGLFFFFF